MNIFSRFTLRTLQKNKMRTLVTIIGIALSVAMFTSVTSIIVSFQQYLMNMEIVREGTWEGRMIATNEQCIQDISKDKRVKGMTVMENLGFARLDDIQNEDKPYLMVEAIDDSFTDYSPINLIKGRMPKNSSEIVLSKHLEYNGGVKFDVGDTLKLQVGTRYYAEKKGDKPLPVEMEPFQAGETLKEKSEKTYTVVGICDRPVSEDYSAAGYSAFTQTDEELIRWYDREDHTHFDVCADDHCQRYQGITRASTDIVRQAIAATRGQVLTSEGNICDARFSKCCGGIFEEFQYCWEDTRRPYLAKQRDYLAGSGKLVSKLPDLTQEAEADRWIRTSPESFCNTTDKKILSQVLNNYDQETTDFYRWKVEYTQDELSALILKRSGVDYGRIIDLVPVARGTSGRLWKLKIVGTKKTRTIGKELEIRRTLSPSHLYSSAFVIDRAELSAEGMPGRFILTGAGWGHGVGLCQIGAAVMGEQGYQYDAILLHYYIGASIEKLYE